MTLEEAKDWLRARVRKGAKCPCCGQFAKVYARSINGAQAATLIDLYHLGKTRGFDVWIQVEQELNNQHRRIRSNEYSKLRFWNLIEQHPRAEVDGRPKLKSTGLWRVSEPGIAFVERRHRVKEKALIYDNRKIGMEGDEIGIVDALGTQFDYSELMRR